MIPFMNMMVTVWNLVSKSPTGPNVYQRTVLRHVRYDRSEDGLTLYVEPAYSVATPERAYVEPHVFAGLETHTGNYTFGPEDFIGLGEFVDPSPSAGGKGQRKDWRVTSVLPRTSSSASYLRIEAK